MTKDVVREPTKLGRASRAKSTEPRPKSTEPLPLSEPASTRIAREMDKHIDRMDRGRRKRSKSIGSAPSSSQDDLTHKSHRPSSTQAPPAPSSVAIDPAPSTPLNQGSVPVDPSRTFTVEKSVDAPVSDTGQQSGRRATWDPKDEPLAFPVVPETPTAQKEGASQHLPLTLGPSGQTLRALLCLWRASPSSPCSRPARQALKASTIWPITQNNPQQQRV